MKAKQDLLFRPLASRDLKAVGQIAEESDYGKEQVFAFFAAPKSIGVCAELDGEIVAIAGYFHRKRTAFLCCLMGDAQASRGLLQWLATKHSSIYAAAPESDLEAQISFRELGFRAIKIARHEDGDEYIFVYRDQTRIPS